MKVYVASSWRNERQPSVVAALRAAGHEVYDFRNPPNRAGFGWEQLDPNWREWSFGEYADSLQHPTAAAGFRADMEALGAADATVLVLPCGRSAHLELGYAAGARKLTFILADGPTEPELMYKMAGMLTDDLGSIIEYLGDVEDDKVLNGDGTRKPRPMGRVTQVEPRQPLFYKIPDACERLQISRKTLYRLISRGDIRSVKIGRLTRIPADSLTEYADRLDRQSQQAPPRVLSPHPMNNVDVAREVLHEIEEQIEEAVVPALKFALDPFGHKGEAGG